MENWHGFGFLKISDYDNENSLLLYFFSLFCWRWYNTKTKKQYVKNLKFRKQNNKNKNNKKCTCNDYFSEYKNLFFHAK